MPPGKKAGPPAPIDRPLSKAYLRGFRGWSTAYPPGLSDPTSLRLMENVMITREGAAMIRPALRSVLEEDIWLDASFDSTMVGGFEHFFLNDGTKALLFAARNNTGVVGFKVAVYNPVTFRFDIQNLTASGVDFDIPQGEAVLNFTSATTFVKYLQIDNKIFALSDAGEDLRLFNVGSEKVARKVVPITVPEWDASDVLTVLHPDASWINDTTKTTVPTAETPTVNTLISSEPIIGTATISTAAAAAAVTITIASPGVLTRVGHGLVLNQVVQLTTTGALPTGFTNGGFYYVKTIPTADTFTLSATSGGAVINTTGSQSGVHTLTPVFSGGTIFATMHSLEINQQVMLTTTGVLPTGLSPNVPYYVKTIPTADTLTVSATLGGAAIAASGSQSGVHTLKHGPQANGTPAENPNTYSFGYFYTFENEVGESAASQITIIQTARGWSQWRFYAPDSNGNPTTTSVTEPGMAMDQLVAIMPEAVFNEALAEGAIKWNLYMFTWSEQDAVPPEGVLVGSKDLTLSGGYPELGWIQNTAAIDVSTSSAPLPTEDNRYNYSDPSSASQGLVAGDRLVLVNDKQNGALIRWSSNQVGEYTNFTPSKGGGFKTLTSGNLYIPACVKLWQNPQSVDTITILCSGVDGYSTAFYMAPASVDGQSGSTSIMGFEETTATPGTVSPYGVEVLNNALYHPLDTELMKSTASNYNINHMTMTTDIANKWLELLTKDQIVSSQHDNRLYYLVNNPDGIELPANCNGNEVWVFDGAKDSGSWSRWLVSGIALSKLEVNGKLYMSIARPEGIFVFDELKVTDDTSVSGGTTQTAIPWKIETNTQGANRAHDAWAHLQQVSIVVGNFQGMLKYGIRGRDLNGRDVDTSKIFRATQAVPTEPRPLPYDVEDMLRIARDLKEWFFYAESHTIDDVVQQSFGQLSLVQYRYTPVSVNVGGEYGSVETFEYGRASVGLPTNTDNGVPQPYIDTNRP